MKTSRSLLTVSTNFLEAFGNNAEVIAEQIQYALYDIDDIRVIDCEVMDD